ncbi:MAG TPA: aminotransferase class V-fold PLP-dependent enzyme [Bacteriovoracaceae bacterium]|nr:aminotransferase class V-fold PLP-dependent enzyme [Bacteriovoracaceae bacterium]
MIRSDLKNFYGRFLETHRGKLHFAAHSHHFWPDVTRQAQLQYWDDCARLSDDKWRHIFSEIIPRAQSHIAGILSLKHPKQIVFAPNTHELTSRLLSLFLGRPSVRVLTTTNEFHSWNRQVMRLKEIPAFTVETVSTQQFLEHPRSTLESIKEKLKENYDLFFISQVFYDSGLALTPEDLLELRKACPKHTLMVIDGYHGFAALPCSLSQLEGQVFYLGGGYKYAQAGEGVGFMVVPEGTWRPAYTGWFAEHDTLSNPSAFGVSYAPDAMAFMGATQDPSGLYRFNAAWDLFEESGLDVSGIHQHVRTLQMEFLAVLPASFVQDWELRPLFDPELPWHGHFLTFECDTPEAAISLIEKIKKMGILIDRRGRRLRFGFGIYQDLTDVRELCDRLRSVAKDSQ